MYTTLNKIREHSPCTDGWETLLKYLGKTKPDDEPLSLLTILDSNGFNDTLWCFRAVDGFEKEKLLLALTYAREVEHLMPDKSKKALDVFERYANGLTTQEEFETARDADDAASVAAARAAWSAAGAAYAADAAADAASVAAARAAWFAAAAAYYAADRVYTAADAARATVAAHAAARAAAAADADADADATRSTIKAKQESQLRELLEKTT